ncbi:hypothetical protein ABW636_11525 [Aquimarina sp. 2201CG1-2-11]|uniref:hypothetical protein n=1 Tax=Aquimarina discodermiae TaxID=3231043 RepID=UPI0034634135
MKKLSDYKTIIKVSILTLFIISCTDKSKLRSLENKITMLNAKNDSLSTIIGEFKNKYIFDSIAIHELPIHNESNKIGSVYESNLFVVGYGINNLQFTEIDSISYNPLKLYNPVELKHSRGLFKLSKKLNKERNRIKVRVVLESKYGKTKKSIIDGIVKAQ